MNDLCTPAIAKDLLPKTHERFNVDLVCIIRLEVLFIIQC